jgi:tetratricopeptide (TPR) repeat protein
MPDRTGREKAGLVNAKASTERANQLRNDGRYDEAMQVCEQALAAESAQPHAVDSLPFADLLTLRGVLHSEMGRYAEAERDYRRALEIVEREPAPGDTRLGRLYRNLASLQVARRRPARAEAYARRALALSIEAFGGEHLELPRIPRRSAPSSIRKANTVKPSRYTNARWPSSAAAAAIPTLRPVSTTWPRRTMPAASRRDLRGSTNGRWPSRRNSSASVTRKSRRP